MLKDCYRRQETYHGATSSGFGGDKKEHVVRMVMISNGGNGQFSQAPNLPIYFLVRIVSFPRL